MRRPYGKCRLNLTILFSLTSALSAFLLFWCQPLVGKALLPLLGGTPSVWNTAMMFFQIVLLAGYLYAHAIARLKRGQQALIHGVILLGALVVLPFGSTTGLTPPTEGSPLPWLVRTLVVMAGLPFFAVSASAPLLQSWFGTTGHKDSRDPYFLYAASNAGSLGALLGFPFVLEPALSVGGQGWGWAAGYVALCALLALSLRCARAPVTEAVEPIAPITWRQRGVWVFLGFVPSSLLLGVTAYAATDLASVPLLWVLPLALYLLTFILAFGSKPLSPRVLRGALVGALCMVGGLLFYAKMSSGARLPVFVLLGAHFGAFFLIALVCHVSVAARRPPAARLTEFYVFLSAGGALGGIFNALLAPVLFNWTYEYEIVLVAACVVRALLGAGTPMRPLQLAVPLILLSAVELSPRWLNGAGAAARTSLTIGLSLAGVAALGLAGRRWPVPFAGSMAALLGGATLIANGSDLHLDRSFFGVHRVIAMEGGKLVALIHGNILHGAEYTDAAQWRQMLDYYIPSGPIGQVMAERPAAANIAVIGLGAGELACYAKPGEDWTFFEIDPAVLRLARDARYFHFLQECGGGMHIVIGDGRLALRAQLNARYDVLVVDAFSSDSIPLHMLTREAFDLYASRLAPRGLLVLHISNRYLNLLPAIAATGGVAGFIGLDQLYNVSAAETAAYASSSEWIVLAHGQGDLTRLAADRRWKDLPATPGRQPWTDSYSNILSVLR